MERQLGARSEQAPDGELHPLLTLGGLGELGEFGAVHRQRGHIPPLRPGRLLHQPLLDVQEPQQDLHLCVVRTLGQQLGLRLRQLLVVNGRVRGWHQHAELEPGLVLP